MSKLDLYPYKFMLPIVNEIDPTGLTLKEVKNVSGACTPDSYEIMSMLKYLTSYGVVKQENDSYLVIENEFTRSKIPRRSHLIYELTSIADNLSDSPQSIKELLNKLEWIDSDSQIEPYFDFLAKITAKGPILGDISFLERLTFRGHWVIK